MSYTRRVCQRRLSGLCRGPGEKTGVVAGARADLQYTVARSDVELVEHHRGRFLPIGVRQPSEVAMIIVEGCDTKPRRRPFNVGGSHDVGIGWAG